MFRFRLQKQHSKVNVLEITFTEEQERLLKAKLLHNHEAMELLKGKMFDEYGRNISVNDSIIQVFKTTLKTSNDFLFPRDRYTKHSEEKITYTSALSVELAKRILPIMSLCESVGMHVNYSRP